MSEKLNTPYVGCDLSSKIEECQILHRPKEPTPVMSSQEQAEILSNLSSKVVIIVEEIIATMEGRAMDPETSLKDLAYTAKTLMELRKTFSESSGDNLLEKLRANIHGGSVNIDKMAVAFVSDNKRSGVPNL